jgi:hypothetical protein
MTGIVVCTYVMQCDGIYIGSLDFAHLPRTNLVACGVCSAMLYYGKQHGYGLTWVWWCMVCFFIARLVQHVWHAARHWETSAFGHYRPKAQDLAQKAHGSADGLMQDADAGVADTA